jgi:hypothetical protein
MEIVGFLSVSLETFVEFLLTRNMLTEPLPSNGLFRIYSFHRERALGGPLASNGLPLWLYYSDFQVVLTESLPSNGHIRHNTVHESAIINMATAKVRISDIFEASVTCI